MIRDLSDLPDCPAVDESAKTWQRLEPITFMGERVPPWPADRAIPPWPRSQADISTLDLKVRATPSVGSSYTQPPPASDALGGSVAVAGGGGASFGGER